MRSLVTKKRKGISLIWWFAAFVFVAIPMSAAFGQFPQGPWDPNFFGPEIEPEKVALETGKYKLVYRNESKVVVREEIYELRGSMIQVPRKVEATVFTFHPNGKRRSVGVHTFGEDPNKIDASKGGPVIRQDVTEYNPDGSPLERIVYQQENGKTNIDNRTVTKWPPGSGPAGVTHREKFNRKSGRYEIVKTSAYAGKWRLETDGQKNPGEYTFDESPGVAVLRHDSKVWLLVLSLKSDPRTVTLPAEANDQLGFARRLIQLRGDATSGRLEFWLTPDLTVGEFKKTSHALVREDR